MTVKVIIFFVQFEYFQIYFPNLFIQLIVELFNTFLHYFKFALLP